MIPNSKIFSTPAILLRRTEYGDHDLILTFFTPENGKLSVMAKSAKKSIKRFAGLLESFSVLQLVCTNGRGKLPVLQEAALEKAFFNIRSNIRKTAYACYWAELISEWSEEDHKQHEIYRLFHHVLDKLDNGETSENILSILFQMRFMSVSGFCPNLNHCCNCGTLIDKIRENRLIFDLAQGGIVCARCVSDDLKKRVWLSKGTIKQLQWLDSRDTEKAGRIRFNPQSVNESLYFLEAFVPYHIGRQIRSLEVLRQVRI